MYCKNCGKIITDDSKFCPFCGTKQETLADKTYNLIKAKQNHKNILDFTRNKTNQLLDNTVIHVPENHHFCAYCGEIKPNKDFEVSNDEEYYICNQCRKRSKIFDSLPFVIWILLLCSISVALFILERDDEWWAAVLGLILGSGLILLPCLVLGTLIEWLLSFTQYRVNISKKRREYLLGCKDQHENMIIKPIIRTEQEEIYYKKTGVYRSRDFSLSQFKCPCCENLYSYDVCKSIDGRDTDIRPIGTIFGTKMLTTTTEYRYLVCPECYKYKNVEKYIVLTTIILGTILVPALYCFLKGFTIGRVIGFLFIGLFGGAFMGTIIIGIYRIFLSIFYKQKIFIKFSRAAQYGALTSLK